MPRPSCRMYTSTPRPSRSMMARALWSCAPQSQRREPNTSPVRHSECTRTSTGSCGWISPCTSAMWVCVSTVEVYPRHLPDEPFGAHAVRDEVRDGHDLELVLPGQLLELLEPGELPVAAQH